MVEEEHDIRDDDVALELVQNTDSIQKRHDILVEDLKAQLARCNEINKEAKSALNTELALPEHTMLGISHAAKVYRDSSEAYELVLLHLVQSLEEFTASLDALANVKSISKAYEETMAKQKKALRRAITLLEDYRKREAIIQEDLNICRETLDQMTREQLIAKSDKVAESRIKSDKVAGNATRKPNPPNEEPSKNPKIEEETAKGSKIDVILPKENKIDVILEKEESINVVTNTDEAPKRKLGRPPKTTT